MFHADSFDLALTTIAAVRAQPSLAAAVRRSTRRPNDRGWIAEFIRYPQWARLLEEYSGPDASEPAAPALDDDSSLPGQLAYWDEPTPLASDWRLRVECASLHQKTAKQSLHLAMIDAESLASFIAAANQWAECELGAPVAVWVGDERGTRGAGVGPLSHPVNGSRHLFEQRDVPWCFRQSREFRLDRGLTALVYAGVAIEGLDEWAAALARARALDAFRSRPPDDPAIEMEIDARYWSAVAAFGAGAGHTINNPLGAIAGLAERLLDDEIEPERRASLFKIRTQVDRIHRMIRDLHFLGRPAAAGTASLADGIRTGVAKALARFADKPTPRCAIAEAPPKVLAPLPSADLARLVEELVANALDAAGPHGFVEVRSRSVSAGAEIEVIDSGPGFSSLELALACAPFYASRSAGRGLGMGLTVSRRLIERAGGQLTIKHRRPTTILVFLPTPNTASLRRAA